MFSLPAGTYTLYAFFATLLILVLRIFFYNIVDEHDVEMFGIVLGQNSSAQYAL